MERSNLKKDYPDHSEKPKENEMDNPEPVEIVVGHCSICGHIVGVPEGTDLTKVVCRICQQELQNAEAKEN